MGFLTILGRIVVAMNPPMFRIWYWNQDGERAWTRWCASLEELERVIDELPKGTEIIGKQTDPHGEIF
jgi:hypothetical protein